MSHVTGVAGCGARHDCLAPTHTLIHTHTQHTLSLTRKCIHTIRLLHTHTHARIHTHTRTHTHTHTQAWQDVVPDKVAYQEVWRRIVENAQDVEKLKVLSLLVATVKVRMSDV